MDKFMMLTRRFLRQAFNFLSKDNWEKVNNMIDIFSSSVISNPTATLGFRLHFTDVYLEEVAKAADTLCTTITKLAITSKAADNVLKSVKVVESTCMNNEVTLEELDKNLRATVKMVVDNDQKLDEISRKLGVQEAELKRGTVRAEIAEQKLKGIEDELETVGDNMKQLEKSAEKPQAREEKLVDKILGLQGKYKITEAKFEYGEMNITKLNQRIDDIEDEIYREKLKVKKSSDELDDTFDDMLANY